MGNLWTDGCERGLFKTTDAGKTWKPVLKAAAPHDAHTGCGDVMIDPTNAETIYAGLYARQRTPLSFGSGPSVTGGAQCGVIYNNYDVDTNWRTLGGDI